MINQVSLDIEIFVFIELLNVYHEHIFFGLTVCQNVLLIPVVHFNLFKQFKFSHKQVTSQVLLNCLLSTWMMSITCEYCLGQHVETTLENIEQFPETHGVFLELFLDLVINSFEVIGRQQKFVILKGAFTCAIPYLKKDLLLSETYFTCHVTFVFNDLCRKFRDLHTIIENFIYFILFFYVLSCGEPIFDLTFGVVIELGTKLKKNGKIIFSQVYHVKKFGILRPLNNFQGVNGSDFDSVRFD